MLSLPKIVSNSSLFLSRYAFSIGGKLFDVQSRMPKVIPSRPKKPSKCFILQSNVTACRNLPKPPAAGQLLICWQIGSSPGFMVFGPHAVVQTRVPFEFGLCSNAPPGAVSRQTLGPLEHCCAFAHVPRTSCIATTETTPAHHLREARRTIPWVISTSNACPAVTPSFSLHASTIPGCVRRGN